MSNRISFIILGISSLCLASCNGLPFARWESLPVGIAAVSDAEIATIDLMNKTLGAEVFVVDPNGVKIIYKPLKDFSCAGKHGGTGCTTFRQDQNGFIAAGEITLRTLLLRSPDYALMSVLAHELGHVLGHGPHAETGIMQVEAPIDPDIASNLIGEFSDWFYSEYPEVEEGSQIQLQDKTIEEEAQDELQ